MSRVAIVVLIYLAVVLRMAGSQLRTRYQLASIYTSETPCNSGATKVPIDFQRRYFRSGTSSRSSSDMEVLQFTLNYRDLRGDTLLFERQTIDENEQTFALCLKPGNSYWLTLYSYIPASVHHQARSSGTTASVTGAMVCSKHEVSLEQKFDITPSLLEDCSLSSLNSFDSPKDHNKIVKVNLKSNKQQARSEGTLNLNDPSLSPTVAPSPSPTRKPTKPRPTPEPSDPPTSIPTSIPTSYPTAYPTPPPTSIPTSIPTSYPSPEPTSIPTATPTFGCNPSNKPTDEPSSQPSAAPTSPTSQPTSQPSQPSSVPTAGPSIPSVTPTLAPSAAPSVTATPTTQEPSLAPTVEPSVQPSTEPTAVSTLSSAPTISPSVVPSTQPTVIFTNTPTIAPSAPTSRPTSGEIPRPTNEAPGAATPQDEGSKKRFVETDVGFGTLAGAGAVALIIVAIVVYYCVSASKNLVKVPQAPPNLAMRI